MSDRSSTSTYPVSLRIDYPERDLNRLTSFFRGILIVPIGIILALVSGPGLGAGGQAMRFPFFAGGFLFLPTLLMILFRWKYPRWWFDWNVSLTRFGLRVGAYFALLTDVYPSTDEEQVVHAKIEYPNVQKGPEGRPSPREVVPGNPPLHRSCFPWRRSNCGRHHRLVLHSFHGKVSPGSLQLRGWRGAMGPARKRVRVPARHGRIPAVQPGVGPARAVASFVDSRVSPM